MLRRLLTAVSLALALPTAIAVPAAGSAPLPEAVVDHAFGWRFAATMQTALNDNDHLVVSFRVHGRQVRGDMSHIDLFSTGVNAVPRGQMFGALPKQSGPGTFGPGHSVRTFRFRRLAAGSEPLKRIALDAIVSQRRGGEYEFLHFGFDGALSRSSTRAGGARGY